MSYFCLREKQTITSRVIKWTKVGEAFQYLVDSNSVYSFKHLWQIVVSISERKSRL